jgi:hypothetical protein
MKTFRNFNVNFIRRIFALYVEELFTIVKRDIKKLVDRIIQDIIKEAKNKQLQMYSAILYALLIVGEALIDFRNCKSAFANVIENLQKSGLPTGDLPDGSPNQMNNAFKNIISGMNKEQTENGKTEVYIPPLKVVVPGLAGPGLTKPTKGYGKSF